MATDNGILPFTTVSNVTNTGQSTTSLTQPQLPASLPPSSSRIGGVPLCTLPSNSSPLTTLTTTAVNTPPTTTNPSTPHTFVFVSSVSTAATGTSLPQPSSSTSWANIVGSSANTQPLQQQPKHIFSFKSSSTDTERGVSIRSSHQRASVEDYLDAITKVVPAKVITDIYRETGQIFVYFSDKSWATKLIADGFRFRNSHLECFPLGVAPKKVQLSGVNPLITDSMIHTILSSYGVVQGKIRSVTAAVTKPEFKHIRCARREATVLFATDDDFRNLPPFFTVFVNSERFTLGVNTPAKCSVCGQTGHMSRACPVSPPTASGATSKTPPSPANTPKSVASSSSSTGTLPTSVSSSLAPTIVPVTGSTSNTTATTVAISSTMAVSIATPTTAVLSELVNASTTTVPSTIAPVSSVLSIIVPASSDNRSSGSLRQDSLVENSSVDPSLDMDLSELTSDESESVDFQSDPNVQIVSRKRRTNSKRKQSSENMPPPARRAPQAKKSRPISKPRFSFDAATNTWTDAKGVFQAAFPHEAVLTFVSEALHVPADTARTLARNYVNDASAASSFARQVLVVGMTDPAIQAIASDSQRRNERNYYYRLAGHIKKMFPDLSDSEPLLSQ